MNADIADGFLFNQRQELGNAIAKRLRPDETHLWKQPRLMRQMLTTAKADFQPNLTGRQGVFQIDLQLRQQLFHELQMMTAQGFSAAPPVILKAFLAFAHFTAALRAFTRSIFSQEKPPSFSGFRPKWP